MGTTHFTGCLTIYVTENADQPLKKIGRPGQPLEVQGEFFSRSENAPYRTDFLTQRSKTPSADEIREVLKALPLHHRAPLVLI